MFGKVRCKSSVTYCNLLHPRRWSGFQGPRLTRLRQEVSAGSATRGTKYTRLLDTYLLHNALLTPEARFEKRLLGITWCLLSSLLSYPAMELLVRMLGFPTSIGTRNGNVGGTLVSKPPMKDDGRLRMLPHKNPLLQD
ncbi:hypothetical protein BU24DRAFT_42868 [Aaosphaeria arxii CBS 175.79]|uniref:Uncharacterized protein n=1 Tax=Aaosphaeria arxii CBS 175.79 TaxID=1450172 RepID=A0A6A5YCL1_9PLEO|nr:uncharacterized protein BU24DRAFT_42868 [Aaosphaeria arxii CBS 175.79]KAF2022321.1 hypothetical protein BU24DRAFT_42868 [Aaosphaeria arxii CBS 175.79]